MPGSMSTSDCQQNIADGIDIENDADDYTGSDQEGDNDRNEMSRPRKIRR